MSKENLISRGLPEVSNPPTWLIIVFPLAFFIGVPLAAGLTILFHRVIN